MLRMDLSENTDIQVRHCLSVLLLIVFIVDIFRFDLYNIAVDNELFVKTLKSLNS